jgi:hypothetical protein
MPWLDQEMPGPPPRGPRFTHPAESGKGAGIRKRWISQSPFPPNRKRGFHSNFHCLTEGTSLSGALSGCRGACLAGVLWRGENQCFQNELEGRAARPGLKGLAAPVLNSICQCRRYPALFSSFESQVAVAHWRFLMGFSRLLSNSSSKAAGTPALVLIARDHDHDQPFGEPQ